MPATRTAPRHDPAAVLGKATLHAADLLGFRGRELADILGTSEATVSRLRGAPVLDPSGKTGELALLFVRLFRGLDALMGGDSEKARRWLRAENAHVQGIPAERIRRIDGLVDVVQYLDAMRGRV